mgnify:CR=1 FL=1
MGCNLSLRLASFLSTRANANAPNGCVFALEAPPQNRCGSASESSPKAKFRGNDNAKATQGVPSIKQVLPAETQKEYGRFVRTPFHTPCPARYSVLHL